MQTKELINQLNIAFDKRKAGDYSGALSDFESLERRSVHPQDIATLRLFQTMCLTDLERIDEALERINHLDKKKLGPIDQVDYESEYAYIKRAKGMRDEALDHVDKALKMADSIEDQRRVEAARPRILALKGVLLAESGRCDEAIPILQEVSASNPWWAEATIHLGDCQIRNKLYQEAIQSYVRITSSSKELNSIHRKTALRNIGCAYYHMGEYPKAIEYLTKVEDGYDGSPDLKAELFGMLASAYSRLGMTEKAAKYSGHSRSTNSVQ